MDNIDLHALRILDEIFKTKSLSRTADRLEVSQPAISIALGKLRRHFNDPLFVRIGNEMHPTPQTDGMIDSVRASIANLEATLGYRLSFDARQTDRSFRIAMTDVGQIVLLPRLLQGLATAAPNAVVDVSNLSDRTPQMLETGEVDLAVGFISGMPAGYFQQALFDERFVCLARSDHPRIKRRPTRAQFEAEGHVVVTTSGTGHLIVDRTLEELHIRRKVAVRIPNFLGLPTIIGNSEFICTLPRRAGLLMALNQQVAAWPTPFDLPEYTVKQHWHERQARDPGHQWLRGLMSELFARK